MRCLCRWLRGGRSRAGALTIAPGPTVAPEPAAPAAPGVVGDLNGRYEAPAAGDRRHTLHLDVSGPEALGVLSGSLWQDDGRRVFVVVDLIPDGDRRWTGAVSGPIAGTLTVEAREPGPRLQLALPDGRALEADRLSPYFRDMRVDLVREQGVIWTPSLNVGGPEPLSVPAAFRRAGIDATLTEAELGTTEGAIGFDANTAWDDIELHDAMLASWAQAGTPGWSVWAFVARQHEEGRDLAGLMFDGPGGPDAVQRQGVALFANARMHVASAEPGGLSGAEASRNRFFSMMHELGHALNLAHSWEKALVPAEVPDAVAWEPPTNRPGARSWMNYPHRVAGFWTGFDNRFDRPELRFLRHAPEEMVRMGGDAFFVNHAMWTGVSGPLRLSLVSLPRFAWLEPVRLGLRVSNPGAEAVQVPGGRRLCADALRVLITGPDGQSRVLRPFRAALERRPVRPLAPGEAIAAELYAGGDARRGGAFARPGRYAVRVGLVHDGRVLAVGAPFPVDIEAPARPEHLALGPAFAAEAVCRLYAFGGSNVLTGAAWGDPVSVVRSVAQGDVAPAARLHAGLALAGACTRDRRVLQRGRARVEAASPERVSAAFGPYLASSAMLLANPLFYFDQLQRVRAVAPELARAGLKELRFRQEAAVEALLGPELLATELQGLEVGELG